MCGGCRRPPSVEPGGAPAEAGDPEPLQALRVGPQLVEPEGLGRTGHELLAHAADHRRRRGKAHGRCLLMDARRRGGSRQLRPPPPRTPPWKVERSGPVSASRGAARGSCSQPGVHVPSVDSTPSGRPACFAGTWSSEQVLGDRSSSLRRIDVPSWRDRPRRERRSCAGPAFVGTDVLGRDRDAGELRRRESQFEAAERRPVHDRQDDSACTVGREPPARRASLGTPASRAWSRPARRRHRR